MMSGSSLDGIDLALCRFVMDPEVPQPVLEWSILAAETDPYPPLWRARLSTATELSARESWRLHADLGRWFAERAADFLARHPHHLPTLVGCHGHTVYHEPALGFTVQLGDGAAIAARLDLPVVTDLRAADVAAGGQGAPLAPVADLHLFPDYPAALNLGGIANFSLRRADGSRVAGDVSGCCQILDRLAAERQLPYDAGGELARRGAYRPALAARIDRLTYHAGPYPKSLSNEWVTGALWPLLRDDPAPVEDRLRTFCDWLAERIARDITAEGGRGEVLVTGGGAHNDFLVERLRATQYDGGPLNFTVGRGYVTDYKEAALVALCARFRELGLPNSLAAATGASADTVNGALYPPRPKVPVA